jgi:hypothetical protein
MVPTRGLPQVRLVQALLLLLPGLLPHSRQMLRHPQHLRRESRPAVNEQDQTRERGTSWA